MGKRKIILPLLIAGSALVAQHMLSARTATKKRGTKKHYYERIDAYVLEQMKRLKIPGASLVIIEGDQIVHQRGFGQARPGGEVPTAQTPFFIGSLTKSITALAIMQLVEAGKVELDAPVQRYLPWFRVADPEASAKMTVRHLLNQTSGLSSFDSNIALAYLDNLPGAAERQVRAMTILKLHNPLGEKAKYCNLNYIILGLIIEASSGETYPAFINEHIFTPLDMTHTYTEKLAAQQDGLAMGYRHWFGYPFPAHALPIPLGALAAGQLISCAEDMAHYLEAHLSGGRYGERQILSRAGMDELHRGAKEFNPFGSSLGFYAMGWFDRLSDKTRTLSHTGNCPDFSAMMTFIPEQNNGLVLLFNADPYGLPMITDEIVLNLTAILAGQQPQPIKLDFFQWIFRLLPLIPILQIWGVITTLRNISKWHHDPSRRPQGLSLWGLHILPPLIANLSLAAILAYLRSSRLINFMDLFMPDLAWVARISGGFAGLWASLRTRLVIQSLRKSHN